MASVRTWIIETPLVMAGQREDGAGS